MKKIKLNQNKVALIDDKDFDNINSHNWHCNSNGYAVRFQRYGLRKLNKKNVIYMHRFIMGSPKKLQIDHINGDRLDNRKQNLRICTVAENHRNLKKHIDNKVGYKGVSWHKQQGKFCARIMTNGKTLSLGLFKDIKDAVNAYNRAALKFHGDFARLNQI